MSTITAVRPLALVDRLPDEVADRESLEAWRTIAAACDEALRGLSPNHPRRADMLGLCRDAHEAAAQNYRPSMKGA